MKQSKIFLSLIAVIAMTAAGYRSIEPLSHSGDEYSSLFMQNVEALTRGENFEDCDNGCSTNNTRTYCCTLLGHKLYKYR